MKSKSILGFVLYVNDIGLTRYMEDVCIKASVAANWLDILKFSTLKSSFCYTYKYKLIIINRMSNQTKIIAALLAGVAVGAVAGLLLSPDSGEENREELAGWFKDMYRSSKEKAGELAEKGKNAVKSAQSKEFASATDDVEKTLGV